MEFHELSKLLPFREEQVDAIEMRMRKSGWKAGSVVTLLEGKILDGRHRYVAAERVGIEPVYVEYTGGTTEKEVADFVVLENCESRHLSLDEKYQLLVTMREREFWPKRHSGGDQRSKSGNARTVVLEIAKILGVHRETIIRWDSVGRKGYQLVKNRKAVRETGSPELVDAMERGDITTEDAVKIAELPPEEQVEALKDPKSIRTETSGNDEWYTPEKYINLARDVMGDIDLDPASCEFSQKVILANKFYTAKDDGLKQLWEGRVWLNPPYSKGLMDKFIAKICDEYQLGGVTQAIVLTSNFTDTEWFHKLVGIASAICLTRGRIRFYTEEGKGNSPTNGHAFFYFGSDPDRFAEVFEPIGSIVQRRI